MIKVLRYIIYILIGIILGSVLGFFILNAYLDNSGNGLSGLEIHSSSPDFSLYSLSGDRISLNDLDGTPVVINFWATWCLPCKIEMPIIQERYDSFKPDLVVLALDAGESKESVEKFVRDNNITFPALLDLTKAIQKLYLIRAYPTTYFIDKNGIIQAAHIGILSEDQLDKYLKMIGVSDG